MAKYEMLFSPIKIGNVTIPNRIAMNAHVHRISPPPAPPNEDLIRYYETRAKGGAGLITVSHTLPRNICPGGGLGAFSAMLVPETRPAFKHFADVIHQYDTRLFGQLSHEGNLTISLRILGGAPVYSSAISRGFSGGFRLLPATEVPHVLDKDEIKQIVQQYADCAYFLREAGYDGVEIGSIWAFLLPSFLSPLLNKREDEYGGSLENRMRITFEIIDAVRAAVGNDFVVGLKFDGDEFVDGGLTLDDMKEMAPKWEATGKLSFMNVGAGAIVPMHVQPMYFPLGPIIYVAAGIKEVVDLPIISGGRINDTVAADNVLKDHQMDIVAMTRSLITDPELPRKAREEQEDLIRKCIACVDCCWTPQAEPTTPITCAFNPEAGREGVLPIIPAKIKKTVMVIGGGAAGCETARVAALRGHRVTLYDKNEELGGQLNIAAKTPGRIDFAEVPRFYVNQLKALGVNVRLGAEVTAEMVLKEKPDAVVVATGSVPYLMGFSGENVVSTRDVVEGKVTAGKNVVVYDTIHHEQALGVADMLLERGSKVEIVTPSAYPGHSLDESTIEVIYERLLTKGAVFTTISKIKEVKGNTVTIINHITGQQRDIEGVDTVVIAHIGMADDALYKSLKEEYKKGQIKELHIVGQCLSPRLMRDTIWDGARVGRAL